jgi:hypothetical protein
MDVDVSTDDNGNAVLITSRDYGTGIDTNPKDLMYKYSIVAGVDGPVYAAVLSTMPMAYATTSYLSPSFRAPRWILRVMVASGYTNGGYIAGTTASVEPLSHLAFSDNRDHSAEIDSLGVLDISNNAVLTVRDFLSGSKIADIATPSLPMSFETTFHDVVFWQGDSFRTADIGRWDVDSGAVDFINYGFDPNHAAGCLGTDGKDMVWMEGHGAAPDGGAFWMTADYWTSPFTSSSAQLTPHRLRSASPNSVGNTTIAVGCGYAATVDYGVMKIVRISDGAAWLFPNATNAYGWAWVDALAVNCTEAFFRIQYGAVTTSVVGTVARVDLSKLGTPVPAD